MELRLILENIVSSRKIHGRWLNTLSFLEYIGTRKILKSLPANILDETLLSHVAEEAFHSLFFKKLARKLTVNNYSFKEEEMLAPEECENYFQQLDKKAELISNEKPDLNYLYTTWIVETRAVSVYSLYNKILKEKQFSFTLNPILKDEEKHLAQVKNCIQQMDSRHEIHFQELMGFEEQEFSVLLEHLKKTVFQKTEISSRTASTLGSYT
ncbi:MAG: hypothetical protein OXB86_03265 [Bdellovibrionales bacterium]|nr:hypothetical protein [Bdellovibrionales bacterium]